MYAIIYSTTETSNFGGNTWNRVVGLYEGDNQPANSHVITESEYDAWKLGMSYFHYVRGSNKTIGSAYLNNGAMASYTKSLHKENVLTMMSRIFAKVQSYNDLGLPIANLNSQYANLITEYNNIS